jgi:uncharacterized membrane protein YphA (DoxX/SURF4 family)
MTTQKTSKALHISLWIVQGLLAAAFGMAGLMKLTAPIEQLAENGMSFVNDYSEGMVRFIGISELLGALGLIIPAAFRFKTFLTPLAAVGLAIIMVLATSYHIGANEPIIGSVVFFVLTTFIAWGRFKLAPIQAK